MTQFSISFIKAEPENCRCVQYSCTPWGAYEKGCHILSCISGHFWGIFCFLNPFQGN